MIALLNPNKERLNVDPYFNRENRFQTNLNFSQKSEDLQKSNLVIDDKFFNLIDEMENFESTKNKINNFNLLDNTSSSQILKNLNQIEKDVDNINILSLKFDPKEISQVSKQSNEIKKTKKPSTLREINTDTGFKKKMNMFEELKKLNYNYD
jgi:hypothetical protein